jgi:hypothetical protein
MGTQLSRRALLRRGGVLGFLLAGWTAAKPRPVLAAPAVAVAAPEIGRMEGCRAPISVSVTLSGVAPGVRYVAYGVVMEADGPAGVDDYCCALEPQSTEAGDRQASTLLLTRRAMATDLGLQRGMGPAVDETASPERVHLYARVWVRDLGTGDRFGPWESPRLTAVPNPRLVWAGPDGLPGSQLMARRGGATFSENDSIGLPLPPQACIP